MARGSEWVVYIGKEGGICFCLSAGWDSPWGAHSEPYVCAKSLHPKVHTSIYRIPLPPQWSLTHFTFVRKKLEELAFSPLEYSRDTPRSDENRGDNREKNKS